MHGLSDKEIQKIFPLLAEALPIGITLQDRELRLQYINHRHAQLNKLNVSEQLGKRLSEFLPHAADAIEPKLRFVLETGQALIHQEIRSSQPRADGSYLYRLASYYPVQDDIDGVSGVLGIIQDATIDNFQHQLHEESQQRLLRVLDNLFTFVAVLDLDGTLVSANRAPLEAAGISTADVVGKKMWDCHWWSYSESAQEQLKASILRCRQGEVVRYDVQVKMQGEQLMWIDFMLSPLRDEYGRITHLIPSGIDITKRHDSEAALYQSEEYLRSVIESSDDAIITKSLQGIITSWNSAAERLLGYSEEEAIGMSIFQILRADKFEEEKELLEKITHGERVKPFETERIHKSGRVIYVSVTISPLRDSQGRVIGACKLARDISQQKKQREMLEHALEEKTALLHEVHHRVKNNLQIVSSLLNLQARKASVEVAEALAESQGRIKAMALVHQLLYESNNMSEINLAEFLRNLMSLSVATYGIERKGIELILDGNAQQVSMDVQRMIPCGLVINELILNAVKHAFPDQQNGKVYISVLAGDDLIRISVADNGRGLPAGFEWNSKGGLGSQLIPMFVHQLHGELTTESDITGAKFTITLKTAREEEKHAN